MTVSLWYENDTHSHGMERFIALRDCFRVFGTPFLQDSLPYGPVVFRRPGIRYLQSLFVVFLVAACVAVG